MSVPGFDTALLNFISWIAIRARGDSCNGLTICIYFSLAASFVQLYNLFNTKRGYPVNNNLIERKKIG